MRNLQRDFASIFGRENEIRASGSEYENGEKVENQRNVGRGSDRLDELDEHGRKQAPSGGITLDHALHPLFVVGLLLCDNNNFVDSKRQLVRLVGFAIIHCQTAPQMARRIVRLLFSKKRNQ